MTGSIYMEGYFKLFKFYKNLGEQAIHQVKNDDLLFWSPSEESNSIAIIVNHLNGNMMSRWTDFLTSDGEKPWRDREGEFESRLKTREEIESAWERGWSCLFSALASVTEADMNKLVFIRNKGHSIDEAVQRQLAHYAYHIGQIVFLGRLITGSEWKSLSIPKGESQVYNQKAFGDSQRKEHFTEAFKKGDE